MNNDSSDSLDNTETKINGQSYHRKHSFPNVGAFCHQTPQQHKKQQKKPTVFSPTVIKPDQSAQAALPMATGAPSPPLDRPNNKQLLLLKLLVLLKAGSTGSSSSLQQQPQSQPQAKPQSSAEKMPTPPHLKGLPKSGSPNLNISVSSFAQ